MIIKLLKIDLVFEKYIVIKGEKMNLKEIIKNNVPDVLLYKYYLNKFNRKEKKITYKEIEDEVSKDYKKIFKRNLNWNQPETYSEKLNVAKVYGANEIKTKLTDKILVREWIKEKIGEEYLVPLIGIYDKFEDIDFNALPDKFVIKCNHDSGSVTLCDNKDKIDYKKLKQKYDFYIKRNFAYNGYEMHYKDIKPKIMIEKNICWGG